MRAAPTTVEETGKCKKGHPTQKRRVALDTKIELVEMGGIEPPSRNFRREYPTSVVEVLVSQQGRPSTACPTPSELVLGVAQLAIGDAAP